MDEGVFTQLVVPAIDLVVKQEIAFGGYHFQEVQCLERGAVYLYHYLRFIMLENTNN